MKGTWSDTAIGLAARLWAEGLSAARIAAELKNRLGATKTRSAVLGFANRHPDRFAPRGRGTNKVAEKISAARNRSQKPGGGKKRFINAAAMPGRLGLAMRPDTRPDPAIAALEVPPPASSAGKQRPDHPISYDAASRQMPLVALGARDCRFAVNDAAPGEDHLFCGHRAAPGKPYCAHHLARVTGEGTRSERNAARVLGKAA